MHFRQQDKNNKLMAIFQSSKDEKSNDIICFVKLIAAINRVLT